MKLLSQVNVKLQKNEKVGYLTTGLSLAPTNISGYNVCPMASKGCRDACLNLAGMGVFKNVQAARIAKTKMFFEKRDEFMAMLVKEIASFVRKAGRKGLEAAIRLNVFSDVVWEDILVGDTNKNIFETFPEVTFYDYTKIADRMFKTLPANYSLTFSKSELKKSWETCVKVLKSGGNVAAVFSGSFLPNRYMGFKVVDGDKSDARFLDDGKGVIFGLKPKGGNAKRDNSGFVIPTNGQLEFEFAS